MLAKLGFTSWTRRSLRAQIMAVDPSLLVGSPLDDAKLLASLRDVAADLRAFSRKAAATRFTPASETQGRLLRWSVALLAKGA